jgi:putative sugar O-methyltransferase
MNKDNNILISAKCCFESAIKVDYPENFSVGSWWKGVQIRNRESIRNFKNCEEAVRYAQSRSGFEQRERNVKSIIDFKINELKRLFPCFSFEEHKDLHESAYSDKNTLEEIDGFLYSNIFLTHLNHYLRTTLNFKSKIKRVIEIGGGYGALARIFKIMNKDITYTIIDLPESLFFAHVFLSVNFPDANIAYINENKKIDLEKYDFVLIPIPFYQSLTYEEFDIVINTASLQEMPDITVKFWMDFIQKFIQVKMFYSFNYFLNNKKIHPETSKEESNLICPILDPFWKVNYFKINPEVITIDLCARNWLEVYVERIKFKDRNPEKIKESAGDLFQSARLHPKGSNDWFQNIWMAIWIDSRGEFLKEMVDGINKFKLGIGAKNNALNLYNFQNIQDVFAFNKRFAKFCFRKLRGIFRKKQYVYIDHTDYGESHYYENLLAGLSTK